MSPLGLLQRGHLQRRLHLLIRCPFSHRRHQGEADGSGAEAEARGRE